MKIEKFINLICFMVFGIVSFHLLVFSSLNLYIDKYFASMFYTFISIMFMFLSYSFYNNLKNCKKENK